ncbi:MAG: hypothetical protein MEP57_07010 [Microvirga sp.]|nr:hypothetical protein [Microvirga sp.]
MNERDPYRDPVKGDPTLPNRNPNVTQPGVDPNVAGHRTVISQRTSSNGIWIAAVAVVLVALAAFFMMGQPSGTSDVPVTGTIPQTEQPATAPMSPSAPGGTGGMGGAPALDAPPASAPPAGAPPAGGQLN